jgi:hypothetical protein
MLPMWYSSFVKSARSFRLSATAIAIVDPDLVGNVNSGPFRKVECSATMCVFCIPVSEPGFTLHAALPTHNRAASILRTLFQVPYPVSPVFATLTKTAGVCTNNSHSGSPECNRGELAAHHSRLYSTPCPTDSCALFCSFLDFFASSKDSTRFFSCNSALFAQNTRGGGGIVTRHFSPSALSVTIARLSVARRKPTCPVGKIKMAVPR